MKKSIVIILIILIGFSGLSYGEIPDVYLKKLDMRYIDYLLLKVEMEIRSGFGPGLELLNKEFNLNLTIGLNEIEYVSSTKKILIGYDILTIKEKEYLKMKHNIKKGLISLFVGGTISTVKKQMEKIDENKDIEIRFNIRSISPKTGSSKHIETVFFRNGKLNFK